MKHRIHVGALLASVLLASAAIADVKISNLPAGTTLGGTEPIPAVQSAATVRTTPAAIATYVESNLTGAEIVGKFSGTCNSSTFLRGDASCAAAGGGFGSDSLSQWNDVTAELIIGSPSVAAKLHAKDGSGGSAGTAISLLGGAGHSNDGGQVNVWSGNGGGGGGAGGQLILLAGQGTVNGAGGAVTISGGQTQVSGTGPAAGGAVNISGGDSDQGPPGAITLTTGQAADGDKGAITLKTGSTTRLTIAGAGQVSAASAWDFSAPGNTFTGTVTFSDDLKISATLFRDNPASPSELSTDVDNWNPGGLGSRSVFRVTPDSGAGTTVTGIAAQSGGMEITFFNIGVQDLTFTHEDSGSTAANRILLPGGTPLVVVPDDSVTFWRDSVTARWRLKR